MERDLERLRRFAERTQPPEEVILAVFGRTDATPASSNGHGTKGKTNGTDSSFPFIVMHMRDLPVLPINDRPLPPNKLKKKTKKK